MADNGPAPRQEELPFAPVGPAAPPKERAALVDYNRHLEEMCLRRVDELRAQGGHDPRWLASAKTDIERAFMCMNRAVLTPERIEGELHVGRSA